MRSVDQGRQKRDQVDAAVAPDVCRKRGDGFSFMCLPTTLANFLRTLATPEPIKDWSLTSLKDKLVKIGAKVASHGRYVIFQMAEVAIARQMFQEILRLIAELPAAATTSASVTRENGQINPSATVRAARCAGSCPQLASGFQGS
jgi:hypothetical protein